VLQVRLEAGLVAVHRLSLDAVAPGVTPVLLCTHEIAAVWAPPPQEFVHVDHVPVFHS
jgi:hypothetical protein